MDNAATVIAVVVTYNSDLSVLAQLIDKVVPQVKAIVLVDNGDGERVKEWLATQPARNVSLLALGENRGIASAQNAGIKWARTQGAEQILIFDHDSAPPTNLVAELQKALVELERQGRKVAAVGPRIIDAKLSKYKTPSPFSRFSYGLIVPCYPKHDSPYVSVDFLIASGSLIPVKALDAVGEMAEELFIDYVDIEWGLRARQSGWCLYGVWNVIMDHSLGDDFVVVLGRVFPVHSSLRHYYVMRNAVWLSRKSKLNWKWKFGIVYNGLKRFVAYSLFMPKPLKHFRFMCLGFWHGAKGRMGKL